MDWKLTLFYGIGALFCLIALITGQLALAVLGFIALSAFVYSVSTFNDDK